ncbi:hypothetical protein WA538_004771, partial [Blastocystis sp. DL]
MIIDLFGNRLAKKNPQLDFPEKQIQQEKKARSSFSLYPIIEWCKWNGAYVYAYGCSIAGIICGLLSPLLNMHQGGNLYPYVSEVIRDGIFKLIFIIGCSVGLIPSMIFATNYFKVMTRYNHRQTNSFIRFCVTIINVVELLLFYYSAVSVIGVAYCDMDTYPDQHTLFSFSWVILTNVMELIQLVQMKCTLYKNNPKEKDYLLFKSYLSAFSILGMVNFAVLGSYVPCHSFMLPMDRCLKQYSDDFCFAKQVKVWGSRNVVMLRQYYHCPKLHFFRGLGEFISVVSSMFFLTTMVYDIKNIRSLLEQTDPSSEKGIM